MSKTLALTALITLSSLQVQAACSINLFKKKTSAKTAYTANGQSISASIIKKLSNECKFNIKLMSEKQIKKMAITRLQAKLLKLQGAK